MKQAEAPFTIWETRGPDEGQAYNENYFRNIGTFRPVEAEEKYSYSIEVKPYSIVTVTTLDNTADTSVYNCRYDDIPLDINYSDDFEYSKNFSLQEETLPFTLPIRAEPLRFRKLTETRC
ncbi:MAG: hypothetical protein L6V87_01765 [Ruminococcus sp.]|nr:MAG: hypothetical protein L6V87_01765 [Ruminococcus sp.]